LYQQSTKKLVYIDGGVMELFHHYLIAKPFTSYTELVGKQYKMSYEDENALTFHM
jgi:hypothetical protein